MRRRHTTTAAPCAEAGRPQTQSVAGITVAELLAWFEAKGLTAYSVSCGQSLVYNNIFPKHKERLGRKVSEVVAEVCKLEVPPSRRHFDVVVACEDEEGEDVDVPLVSIQFR